MAYMEKEGSSEVVLVGYYNVLFYLFHLPEQCWKVPLYRM